MTRNLQKKRNTSCESAQETQRMQNPLHLRVSSEEEGTLSVCTLGMFLVLRHRDSRGGEESQNGSSSSSSWRFNFVLLPHPMSHLFTSPWEDVHISSSSSQVQRVSPRRSLGFELSNL